MASPGNNPPPDARSGPVGALRDSYRKLKAPNSDTETKRSWYRRKRSAE